MARIVIKSGSRGQPISVETIRTEVKALDYDKFLGTIGLAADKPAGTLVPHHTSFPTAPDEGNWLRSVSEATIDGQKLLVGQAWMCVTAATGEGASRKAADWEVVQQGTARPIYPTYANCIGDLRRTLANNVQIPTNTFTFIKFAKPTVQGAFNTDPQITFLEELTNLGNLVVNNCEFDIYCRLNFAPDLSGTRAVDVMLYSYYPSGNNAFSLMLENYGLDSATVPAFATLLTYRQRVRISKTEPLDENPITHAIAVRCLQNSGSPLSLIFGELKIVAWD